jgi:hypothetical protein
MGKFRVQGADLYTKKTYAHLRAMRLRQLGFRAEVHPSSKTTQKRSPHLKWVVFKGQRRS